jgi:hypothetical protein
MSVSIIQSGSLVNMSQSPIPFTLEETSSVKLNSGYQYAINLYYWTGSITGSGSLPDYTMVKYPNNSGVGIFDVSRILNSTLTDLVQENPSNVGYFAIDAYDEWISGTTYVTGSKVRSTTMKYIDGYSLFPEPISQSVNTKTPHWPLMTSGPVTQSALDFNTGYSGVWVGTSNGTTPTKIVYTTDLGATGEVFLSGSTSTTQQVQQYPIGPDSIGLGSSVLWYTIQAYNGATPLGTSIRYDIVCNEKYPNVRIKWKNRFGQFDWFNFNMVNRQTFNVSRSIYQPQLGSWEGRSLGYQSYDSSNLNYLVDASETISVNTNLVPETYNDIFKQLLVSDEVYWQYDEANNLLKPITINTNTIQFKTGVVDKTIQYGFDFNYGQQYKLII